MPRYRCCIKAYNSHVIYFSTMCIDTSSRPAPGSTQPPIQWIQGTLSPGVKRPELEADHSTPSNAEVKSGGHIRLHGVVLN
jgi:hypothetical protein